MDQSFLILDLLRAARSNPALSAFSYLNDNFEFNATLVATPGTKFLGDSNQQTDPYGNPTGEKGDILDLLRSIIDVFKKITKTRSKVNSDIVMFYPLSKSTSRWFFETISNRYHHTAHESTTIYSP